MSEELRTTETRLDTKSVELRIPGHLRTAFVTGSRTDQSVVGAIQASGGYYEPGMMERIGAILEPDSISLDIGANIGVISIAMAWASPHGQVYAFEASSTNHRHLSLNVGENTAGNVSTLNVALYDEVTELEISYVPSVAGCSFLSPTGLREGTTETVAALPLDDWVESGAIGRDGRIRLIKMDVEGAETRVVRGARRTIEAHRPDMLIEFNPVPIERFFNEQPRALAETLLDIFPTVEVVHPLDGSLRTIESFEGLMEHVVVGPGWVDLHCRF